jgi:hypothetical protein
LQPDAEAAQQTWRHVADQLRPRWPKLAALMDDSEHDVLAYMTFPSQHRTKLHSTDEIDKAFSAGSLAQVGTGRALELLPESFCRPFFAVKGTVAKRLLGSGFVNAESRRKR